MSASLPGVSEPTLRSSFRSLAPWIVAKRITSREVSSSGKSFQPCVLIPHAGVRFSFRLEKTT